MEPPSDWSSIASRPTAPSGLVTFVFTDGEGSTRLLRELGDAYIELLDHHHRVLRDVWQTHDGFEFFTEGDAFGVAFASVDQALAACLEAQWRLQNEPWPNGIRMPVRMGVHTGLAAPRNGDYIALAVHQTSRVVAAAHGDQIVVTADALAAVGPEFLSSTRDMGAYQVRDFDAAVRLHQVSHSGLTNVFPALRVPPARLHNLSRPSASFVGRADAVDRLEQLVEPGRVVSIVGPGGTGKTRLCTEFAFSSVDRWPDGVWFVELGPLDQGDLVEAATAATLGLGSSDAETQSEIIDHLVTRSTLVVFDNAEHVIADVARLISTLLGRAPSTAIVVTSREPLGLRGERVMRLEPLSVDDAARLFIERASDVGSPLPQSDDDGRLRELCIRLDCLPLALEMAAARTEVFTLDELLDALESQTGRLSSADSTVESRHRTLAALIDWSVRLLDERSRDILLRSAAFAASFSAAGLHAVCGERWTSDEIDEALYDLTRKSLLATDSTDGDRRFRLLETVRTQLRACCTDGERYRDAVAVGRWLVATTGPEVPRNHRWLAHMTSHGADARYIARAVASRDPELAAQLMAIVRTHHEHLGSVTVGVEELEQFGDLLGSSTAARLHLVVSLAGLHIVANQLDKAAVALAEADALSADPGVPDERRIELLLNRAELAVRSGRPHDALEEVESLVDQALPPHLTMELWALVASARAAVGDAQGDAAASRFAVDVAERCGAELVLPTLLSNLADAHLRLGDHTSAATTQLTALALAEQLGLMPVVTMSTIMAAWCAAETHEWHDALWLQTYADRLLDDQGIALFPADRQQADTLSADARRLLGESSSEFVADDARRAPIHTALRRTRSVLSRSAQISPARPTQGDPT